MNPWNVSNRDKEIIYDLLHYQVAINGSRELSCLEWGAGGSTVTFPLYLSNIGTCFQYCSIEHDRKWWGDVVKDLVKHDLEDRVSVELVPCDGYPKTEPMDSYVDYPLGIHPHPNFIFIDGRKRRRCLKIASTILAPHGVVVLHDAHREYYHCAFDSFKHGRHVGDDLWVGSHEPVIGYGLV